MMPLWRQGSEVWWSVAIFEGNLLEDRTCFKQIAGNVIASSFYPFPSIPDILSEAKYPHKQSCSMFSRFFEITLILLT